MREAAMAKRVEGRSDRLLECAKAEFLEMGFQEASLRVIAAKADTSTGAIYTRFQDKEGLFHALVDDTANCLLDWFEKGQRAFANQPSETQKKDVFTYKPDLWEELVNYICVEKKHTKVAYISGDAESEVSKARMRAFKEACADLGINIRADYIRESRYRDIRDVTRKTEELLNLPDPPTCIMFPDDYAAIGGINVIHNRGLEVPKDISYCGYDGVDLVGLLDPQLATVCQDTDTMGVTAARERAS